MADRPADTGRDFRPARLLAPRGSGLPHARPPRRIAQRRRAAARAAGGRNGLGPGRRVLRVGRAFHRPARPGQPAADRRAARIAIPRQHGDRGRTRRNDHALRRLAGGPRAGRGPARRPRGGPGHARGNRRLPGFAHRPLSGRGRADSLAREPTPHGQDASRHHRRRDDEQPQGRYGPLPALRAGLRDGRERVGEKLAGR